MKLEFHDWTFRLVNRLSTTLFLGLALQRIGNLSSEADQIPPGLMLGALPVARDDGVDERRTRVPHEARQIKAAEGHAEEEVAAVPICLAAVCTKRRPGEFVQHHVTATVASP